MTWRRRTPRGLTLLEVLVSIGIIVLMMATLFVFYDRAIGDRDRGRRVLSQGELAWTLAHKIADEVRSANGFVADLGAGIRGLSHEITLQTTTLPDRQLFAPRSIRDKPLPAQCDVREVRYYLAIDTESQEEYPDPQGGDTPVSAPRTLGIVRREVRTFRQTGPAVGRPEDAEVELLTPTGDTNTSLRFLRFRYFDGVDWVDVWQPPQSGMGNSLPQAVEITVGYKPVPPEDPTALDLNALDAQQSQPEAYAQDRYTVVVRLNQADTFFGSRLMRASNRAASSLSGGSGSGGETSSGF
ncbi:MAG: prepilin-type N-terminal cleavage/methylation domain-containing protein [Phycisphaerae bacterium]